MEKVSKNQEEIVRLWRVVMYCKNKKLTLRWRCQSNAPVICQWRMSRNYFALISSVAYFVIDCVL